MDTIIHYTILIVLALLASAFFSGMEIAFLTANRLRTELDKRSSSLFSRIATLFSKRPGEYLTTILVGNNIALVIYSLTMTALIGTIMKNNGFGGGNILLETIISTIIIIFFAEYLPKTVVKNNPNFYYKSFLFPVYLAYIILYPISFIATQLSNLFIMIFGIKIKKSTNIAEFNKGDLAHLLEEVTSDDKTGEQENEIKIFQNALDFSDLRIRDCMLRRVDIEAIDIACSVEEARKMFIDTKFSRLPVYRENIDHIIGYINIKDLLKSPKTIEDMLLEPLYIPETMSAQKLLARLARDKNSMAIVLDEFGGTAGLITLEDILEEIFGEIEDEHDTNNLVEKSLDGGSFIFSGRIEVDNINEKYNLGIPESDEYDTLAGYIISFNKSLPKQGDIIDTPMLKARIIRMSSSKIELVKVAPVK